MSRSAHLGANVYLWSAREQDRLLVDCLAPAVAEIGRRVPGSRFWFDRFDARGPHLFALLTVPRDELAAVSSLLSSRLDRHLGGHPGCATLSAAELAARHRECRGKQLCAPDGEEGFADPGSYRLFEQPADGYPFHLALGSIRHEELWELVDGSSRWTIERLARGADDGATAEDGGRWLAAIDRALGETDVAAVDYWAFHAQALIPALGEQLANDTPAVLAALQQAMAHPAARALARAAVADDGGGATWPHVERLVGAALGDRSSPRERRLTLLYALNHTTLKQLGLRVALHAPLVLAAWSRAAEA